MTDVLELLARPLWWERAACRGRLDLLDRFVPNTGERGRHLTVADDLKAMCKHCPVSQECLEEAMAYDANRSHVVGSGPDMSIRAGLTAAERVKLRR